MSESPDEKTSSNVVELHSDRSADAPGVYFWDINTDTVFSDSAAAAAFGFNARSAMAGLPISEYLSRMHPNDVPRVAKAIRDTIVSGTPYQEEYRICRSDGTEVEVIAFGTCFRDAVGEPSHYAGIVFQKDSSPKDATTIRQLCLMAYDVARKEGKSDVAEKLIDVLVTLGLQRMEIGEPLILKFQH